MILYGQRSLNLDYLLLPSIMTLLHTTTYVLDGNTTILLYAAARPPPP